MLPATFVNEAIRHPSCLSLRIARPLGADHIAVEASTMGTRVGRCSPDRVCESRSSAENPCVRYAVVIRFRHQQAERVANGWKRDLDCDDEGYLRGSGGGHQLPKRLAQELLSSMVERVTLHLRQGDRIRIGGLGTLEVRKREARTGRNPATGETMQIAASKKVAFRPAKELKEAV